MEKRHSAKEPTGWPDMYRVAFVPLGRFERGKLCSQRVVVQEGRWWRPHYGGKATPLMHRFSPRPPGSPHISSPPETLVRHRQRVRMRMDEFLRKSGSILYAWRDHAHPLCATAYFRLGSLEEGMEALCMTYEDPTREAGALRYFAASLHIPTKSAAHKIILGTKKAEASRLLHQKRKERSVPAEADAAQGVAT